MKPKVSGTLLLVVGGFAAALVIGIALGVYEARVGTPVAAVNSGAGPAVRVAATSQLGQVLTDPAGFTLYTFSRDAPGKSNCNAACTQTWPPLIVTSDRIAGGLGVTGPLTVITRDDGAKQAAYKGAPLYRHVRDTAPGQTNGQGVGGTWFAAKP